MTMEPFQYIVTIYCESESLAETILTESLMERGESLDGYRYATTWMEIVPEDQDYNGPTDEWTKP